jgi:acetyl esterase/lipase
MKAFTSPLDFLNAIAAIGATRPRKGIRYGQRPRHLLDVYQPTIHGPSPVIVFFYGGGWEEGERGDYFFVGSALAARGFTVVIPDYRVFPEVRFPDFIDDAAEAMLIVMGHSAGAHIAAMLAFDRKRLAKVGLVASRDLSAMIGLAGPYDFLPLNSTTLKEIFGPHQGLAATQPINFVGRDAPPTFLATGRRDRHVDPGNTVRMAESIRRVGGEAEIKLYDYIDHRVLIGALARPLRFLAPVLDDIVSFALKNIDPQSLLDSTAVRGSTA